MQFSIAPVTGATGYIWTLPDGWTGSSTGTSITAVTNGFGGTVSVQAVTEACGVGQARTLNVVRAEPPVVEICLVTVDSTSQYNIVAWNRPNTALIDSFYVYRRLTSSQYDRVGAVPFDSLTWFRDFDADPNVSPYWYRITTVDTCGMESAPGPEHNTIHFQSLGNGQFQWTLYDIEGEGNPVDFYRMYRDDFGNGNFTPLFTTLPGGVGTFTVPDFGSFPDAAYVLDVAWDRSCTSSRDVTINTTRSNIERVAPGGIHNMGRGRLTVHPNPTEGDLMLEWGGTVAEVTVAVRNAMGQQVLTQKARNSDRLHITLPPQAGVYVVEAWSTDRTLHTRTRAVRL